MIPISSDADRGRADVRLAHGFAAVAAMLIGALMLLINADVASRTLLNAPLRGVTEIVTLLMPVSVFLVLAWLSANDSLIRAGVLQRLAGNRFQSLLTALELMFAAIAGMLMLAIAVVGLPWLERAWRDNEFLGVAGDFVVPWWPAKLAVTSGTLLLAWFLMRVIVDAGRAMTRRDAGLLGFAVLLALPVGLALCGLDSYTGIGALSVALMFVLLYAGMPVAFALLSAAALGIGLMKADAVVAFRALALVADTGVADYVFGAVPLFVLMGLVLARADIGRDALVASHSMLRSLVGGLGVATVAANALFAAMTGISIASAAIFGKVAVPPLIANGFTPRFAVGLVAGSSVLGMLIPPSLLLIIYGLVAEVSINRLFVAAIVPGLLLSALFAGAVVVLAWLRPAFAMRDERETVTLESVELGGALLKLCPVLLLALAVLGGIYGGVFTPTEAGAVGSLIAFVIAVAMGRMSLRSAWATLFACAETSASILFLIVAASAFGMMLTVSGMPAAFADWVAGMGLGLSAYVIFYVLLLIILGMVIDSSSILLIMVPIGLPAVLALGGDPVWFGIVTVIGVEIGLLTPPLGLSVFSIKAALDDQSITLNDIFLGAMPFTALMLLLIAVLIYAPGLCRVLL